jgi:hypothetical protein
VGSSALETVSSLRLCLVEVLGRSANAVSCASTDVAWPLEQQFCLRSSWYWDPPCCPSSTLLLWGGVAQRSLAFENAFCRDRGGSRWCSASAKQKELATRFSAADRRGHELLSGARSSGGCWCWSWLATGRTEVVVVVEGLAHSAVGWHSQLQTQQMWWRVVAW